MLIKTYTGEAMSVLGELRDITVRYGNQCVKGLSLIDVKGSRASLLGRDWLKRVKLDWNEIRVVTHHQESLKSLLSECADVFADGLGVIKGFEAEPSPDFEDVPHCCCPSL